MPANDLKKTGSIFPAVFEDSEKEESKEEKDEKYTRKEYNFSSFSRSFMLPGEVVKDKIEAEYQDGLLKLTLPKDEEAKKVTAIKQVAVI